MEAFTQSFISRLESSTGLTSLRLDTGAIQRRIELVRKSSDWSSLVMGVQPKRLKTGKSVPVPVTVKGVVLHSLRRALQAYQCVITALTVDELPSMWRDMPLEDRNRFELELVEFYTKLDLQDDLLNFLKEQSCLTSAIGLGQIETNMDTASAFCLRISDLGLVLPGNLGPSGWINEICESVRNWGPRALGNYSPMWTRHRQRCLNICFLKRGLPCLEPWLIDQKLYDHGSALGRKHPDKTPNDPSIREAVKVCLAVLCKECFGGVRFDVHEPLPSLNACFEAGRKIGEDGSGGGSIAALALQTMRRDQGCSSIMHGPDSQCYISAEEPGFEPMTNGTCIEDRTEADLLALLDDLTRTESAPSDRPVKGHIETLERMVEDPTRPGRVYEMRINVALQQALTQFSQLISNAAFEKALSHFSVNALPSAVPEPCKARIVTAGESIMYQRALCLQHMMHSTMRRIPVFRLIGEPITETLWDEMYPPDIITDLLIDPATILVSGDYMAATDNLNPELSEFCWSQISANVVFPDGFYAGQKLIDTPWYDLGIKCMTRHHLWYESRADALATINSGNTEFGRIVCTDDRTVEQNWGQLMGSPMSFPVLNLINAASTCVALGWTTRSGSVLDFCRKHFLQTNGDDISFVTKREKYDAWKCTVTACGLEPSLGKNYVSREFIQINSEYHLLHPVFGPSLECEFSRPHSWKLMSFLNLPILFGMEAKGPMAGKSILDQTPFYEAGPLARSLIIGCDPLVQTRRATAFQFYWDTVLKRAPAGCIWEGPQALGGLGLPRSSNIFLPPESALKRAAFLMCSDTRTRLKAVMPPTAPTSDPVGAALKQSLRTCSVTVDRIVSKTFMDDDNLAVRLRPKGGCDVGALLAHFLWLWSKPGECDTPETTPRMLRVASECRYRRQFCQVSDDARMSSLSPCAPATLLSWSDHRMLEKYSISPIYDRKVRLVGLSSRRWETPRESIL